MSDWWNQTRPTRPEAPQEELPEAPQEEAAPDEAPRDHDLTTLGMLRHVGHVSFGWYELQHLKFIKRCLTIDWPQLQAGSDFKTLKMWHLIFEWLELDRKSVMDLMTLAHSGLVGRAEANRLLWELLS
eukprot:14751086-Heterocapsa_arctica.AAC.1